MNKVQNAEEHLGNCRSKLIDLLKRRVTDESEFAIKVYWNSRLRKQHFGLLEILKAEGYPDAADFAKRVALQLETEIKQVVDNVSAIQYALMTKTGNWAEYGKERVDINFARLKLGLEPEEEIYDWQIDTLNTLMRATPYTRMSVDELKAANDEAAISFFGRRILIADDAQLNNELRFCGSELRIQAGTDAGSGYRSIIFGNASTFRQGSFVVRFVEMELARTPVAIQAVAGKFVEGNGIIRRESCRMILEKKWKDVLQAGASGFPKREEQISHTLKLAALRAYGIHSVADLEAKRTAFIDDMVKQILWHEAGVARFHEVMGTESIAVGRATAGAFLPFLRVLETALADWANPCGPIKRILDLALSGNDPERARGMLLVYLSDNWFLDGEDMKAYHTQTEILFLLLCPFIKTTGEFDFVSLGQRYEEVHAWLCKQWRAIGNYIKDCVETAIYPMGVTSYNFNFVQDQVEKFLDDSTRKGSLVYETAYWTNVFVIIKRLFPSLLNQLRGDLAAAEQSFRRQIIAGVAGARADKYGGDMRRCLMDELNAKGFGSDPLNKSKGLLAKISGWLARPKENVK